MTRPDIQPRAGAPGRKALAALMLSTVALIIIGRLTLWTLLVIAAAGAIGAAARRYRPKK